MAPIRHVLVPVDLSDHSRLAVAKAATIATSCGARLTVLHVSKSAFDTSPKDAAGGDELQARLVDLVGARASDPDTHLVVLPGDPARSIVDFAAAHGVDLIVVGRRHHGELQRLFFESAGEIVTREAACSVLVVAEPVGTTAPRSTSRRGRSRILCAVDLTDRSAATLALAASLARETRTPLTVLHVIENWYPPDTPADGRDETAALRSRMACSAYEGMAELLSAHARPEIHADTLVSFGVPPLEIVRAVSVVGADTLVLGGRSKRRLGHTRLGSTARYVLGDPPCAILLARPPKKAANRPALAPDRERLATR